MTEDNSWRTAAFRQSIVSRIEVTIRQSGMNTSRNNMIEMENLLYVKAKTRDKYLGFIARLILNIRELGSKKNAEAMGGPQRTPGAQQSGSGQIQAQVQGNQLQNQLAAGGMNQIGANANAESAPRSHACLDDLANLLQLLQMPSGEPPFLD